MAGCGRLGASLAVASTMLMASGVASAAGYGLYFEYGRGFSPGSNSVGRNEVSLGFALDTNVAADRLFNYRLDVGYHRIMTAERDAFVSNGLMLNNAFGFGVLRTRTARLWLGPALRLNWGWGVNAGDAFGQIGLGPQIGVNFHTGPVSLVLSSAYNYEVTWVFGGGALALTGSHRVSVNLALLFRSSVDRFD